MTTQTWRDRINAEQWPREQHLTERQADLIEETAVATDFKREAAKFVLHHTEKIPTLSKADYNKWSLTGRLVYWLGRGHVRVTPVADRQPAERGDDASIEQYLAAQKARGNG